MAESRLTLPPVMSAVQTTLTSPTKATTAIHHSRSPTKLPPALTARQSSLQSRPVLQMRLQEHPTHLLRRMSDLKGLPQTTRLSRLPALQSQSRNRGPEQSKTRVLRRRPERSARAPFPPPPRQRTTRLPTSRRKPAKSRQSLPQCSSTPFEFAHFRVKHSTAFGIGFWPLAQCVCHLAAAEIGKGNPSPRRGKGVVARQTFKRHLQVRNSGFPGQWVSKVVLWTEVAECHQYKAKAANIIVAHLLDTPVGSVERWARRPCISGLLW